MDNYHVIDFFVEAFDVVKREHQWEIDITENRYLKELKIVDFIEMYVFVVCNSGMKNQIAEKIYVRFMESDKYADNGFSKDFSLIGHPKKREAIEDMYDNAEKYFSELIDSSDKLAYLETLKHIGPITKYHLARNIGMDVAKPDRHMIVVAKQFKFDDVQNMCEYVSNRTGWRVGTVDVILWRYCNLHPEIVKKMRESNGRAI